MQGDMEGGIGSSPKEEKIFVSIRVRPLNEKEISRNDVSDWECINNTSIIFKHTLPDRAMFPTAYTFDRVFGADTPTKQVYEEGARAVALSAVSGINSSIFAYGQTSSGKTYTMTGVTECAVADMYNYIDMHKERQYLLKFSAMEIYNEAVRDLLSSDSGPLRLLDDPEKGTVVERLTEVTLKDWSHLKELLSICEAERKIGETSLNETSSRSHQIMRLTIESTAREYRRMENSSTLAAQVNFVDLAGSERASQTLSVGTRLKEGSHINRSLLTLGTVIRKLSKGRNGHVPYRDSKLTRILQNSLGGNARTAIICTMSPARSHVEQSRNTLLFASCANKVTTNAQVNVMMSDKAMVKQLQKELARLENELKSLVSGSITYDFAALLKEKDLLIEKMDQEVNELKQQLDLAQSQVENRQQSDGEDRILRIHDYSVLESLNLVNPPHLNLSPRTSNMPRDFDGPNTLNSSQNYQQIPEDNFPLDSTPKFVGPDPYKVWEEIAQRADAESEDSCKEVRCIEVEESQMDEKIEATPSLHGPKEIAGQLPLQEVMKEDAVTPPQKGIKEALNEDAITSPQKGTKEAMSEDAITSPQKGTKEAMSEDAITSPQKGTKEPISEDAITSPQKGTKEDMSEDAISSPYKRYKKVMNECALSSLEKEAKELSNANVDCTYDDLKQKIQSMQKAISCLISFCPSEQSPNSSEAFMTKSGSLKLTRSRSCKPSLSPMPSYNFEKAERNENSLPIRPPKVFDERPEDNQQKIAASKFSSNVGNLSRKSSQSSFKSDLTESQYSDKSDSEDTRSILSFATESSEAARRQSKKQYDEMVQRARAMTYESRDNVKDAGLDALQPGFDWPIEFERKRRVIIELWDACNVPLIHRTYFFLLFKGESSDSVYMEVEYRRLSFLKDKFSHGTSRTKESDPALSAKALKQERVMLCRKMQKKFSKKERVLLYQKWGIKLNTKQRCLQLAYLLWKDTKDMNHINESASLIANLMGFVEPGQAPKEIFGLSVIPGPVNQRAFKWKHSLSSLSSVS
ncbi:kinesin-like protein KIN-7F [Castanea sativa]|uniref:kinesin-like protein KIN-7F n=1 Tax=Castanea sativa TaxID=21020 RepID=UPI003F64FDE4